MILIGGTSHAGKSTLAGHLGERPGWSVASTDKLARHPGRPWRRLPDTVPPHVAEHYLGLDADALMASVLAHYRTMWPLVETLVKAHAEDPSKPALILEGSALLPEKVASLRVPGVSALWLIGEDRLIETRIQAESRYDEADSAGRAMIDKFVERSRRFNRLMLDEVVRLSLPHVSVDTNTTVEALAETFGRLQSVDGSGGVTAAP